MHLTARHGRRSAFNEMHFSPDQPLSAPNWKRQAALETAPPEGSCTRAVQQFHIAIAKKASRQTLYIRLTAN